jgi:hypothetical protein
VTDAPVDGAWGLAGLGGSWYDEIPMILLDTDRLAQDALLLSANLRDFEQLPGLKVEDWLHG